MPDKLYRIKPLEWNPQGGYFSAQSLFGRVYVYLDSYDVPGIGNRMCSDTLDGKSKAEAWYLSRLMPALVEVETAECGPSEGGVA